MPRDILIPALLLSAIQIAEASPFPSDLFLPHVTWTESFSMRTPQFDEGNFFHVPSGRMDFLVRESNAEGESLRTTILWGGNSSWDSSVFLREWSSLLPPEIHLPAQEIRLDFHGGEIVKFDTVRYRWDASTHCALGLRANGLWRDSSCYDSRFRLVYGSERGGPATDTNSNNSFHEIYRAWYRNLSDSLPQIAIARGIFEHSEILDDSIFAVGDPNRPDSLRGKRDVALFRDESGRIIKATNPDANSDSVFFAYDDKGRLVRRMEFEYGRIDTSSFLYAWSDPIGIRKRSSASLGVRLVANHLQVDLPAPEHVRIERISWDGKRLGLIADRNLPAGRTLLPISVKPGDLVRIHTSRGQSTLVAPPR
ncbi:MAG: hypothetical protein RL173_3652 [Fibrobacterota bacterium]|jgi:hypothetical protein